MGSAGRRSASPLTLEALRERRYRAMDLLRRGVRPSDVARQLGVHPVTISVWQRICRAEGMSGLLAMAPRGRRPLLTLDQAREVLRLAAGTPAAAGLDVPDAEPWTRGLLVDTIRARFGVTYSPSGLPETLRRLERRLSDAARSLRAS